MMSEGQPRYDLGGQQWKNTAGSGALIKAGFGSLPNLTASAPLSLGEGQPRCQAGGLCDFTSQSFCLNPKVAGHSRATAPALASLPGPQGQAAEQPEPWGVTSSLENALKTRNTSRDSCSAPWEGVPSHLHGARRTTPSTTSVRTAGTCVAGKT